MRQAAITAALVSSPGLANAALASDHRAVAVAVNLPYAQVKNDFLVLAGCVKADIPTNTAEDLHDDSKTNDHPATPVDRGR
jgi:1,4-dihydroxy-2-naphthoate octaprenyltransferase